MSESQAGPRRWLSALVLGAAVLACYRPTIQDGGLLCDLTVVDESFQCPEGFKCAADNHCWRDPTKVKGDGGDGKPACQLPFVTPLCADPPAAGQACNPACQTGCECGRCNVVGGVPTCVAPGGIKLGEVCKLGAEDNCAPGLYCQREGCGNELGRCYRHCTKNDQCTGSVCSFTIDATAFKLCEVAPQTCDPLNDTGCPSPALHCYITSGDQTLCDCARNATGKGLTGDPCVFYSDCAPGYVCFRSAGEEPKCRAACLIATPACGAGEACTGGTKYGHCGG
jgi:hypothetical protein